MNIKRKEAIESAISSGRIIVDVNSGTVFSKKTNKNMGYLDRYGYLSTVLYHNKQNVNILIHQIIALAGGLDINGDITINHINGIKTDNRITNLEIMTARENTLHAKRLGLHRDFKGTNNPKNKLSEIEVKLIRLFCDNGARFVDMAKQFNVTQENISQIARRKTWQTI